MGDFQIEKRRKTIINLVYYLLITALIVFFFRRVIHVLMPFIFGLIVAMLLRPAISFFTHKCRFKRSIATIFTLVLFYCTIGLVLFVTCFELVYSLEDLIRSLPAFYSNTVAPALTDFADTLEHLAKSMFPQFAATIDDTIAEINASVSTSISSVSVSLLGYVANFATKLPRTFLNVIIAIVSSFFIAMDYASITRFVLRQLPSHTRTLILRVKNELGSTLIKYLKSYSLIMLWTFCELWLGLSLIGIQKAGLIALVIAIFDILPVIGSGLFLIPWTIASFILGNIGQGIGLAVLYLLITVIRNIIEPRIVGTQVGLPPILTLMAMVIGTYLFGGIGLLGLPVSLAIAKNLNDQGFIHLYRDFPADIDDNEQKPDLLSRIVAFLQRRRRSKP